jgi:transcriptional regulator with XRE-family HTH domain
VSYDVCALGRYLRQQRESYGLSQAELASFIGLKQRKVSRIELGQIADPGFFDLVRFAGWFGVRLEHIARVAKADPQPEGERG